MRLGAVNSNDDVHGKSVRAGSVTLGPLDLTKAVTFSSAMPNTNYKVFFQPEGNLSSVAWATSKGTGGFTINLSAGVTGDVSYCAIEVL